MSAADRREVRAFESWLSAEDDAHARGACMVFDVHFRFWSVPTELTLHQMHDQIIEHCRTNLIPFELAGRTIPTPPRPAKAS